MPLPNFFLLGAPKCGTTALNDSLEQHPDIYMSPVKEPYYFLFDGPPTRAPGPAGSRLLRSVWRSPDYLALFQASKGERALGEASTLYLSSPIAARRIKENVPASKLIAILRQPAERAHSHYWFMRQHGAEPATTFELALEQEAQRRRDGWFSGLYHKHNGFYGEQLARYYDLFPREQIKVLLYDDLKQDPRALLQDIFQFLGVDSDFPVELATRNATRVPRIHRFHRLAERHPKLLGRLDARYNVAPTPALHPQTWQQLTDEYREDILKLQDLIGRDLSGWLHPKPR